MLVFHQDCKKKKRYVWKGAKTKEKKNQSEQITQDLSPFLKRVIAWLLLDLPMVIHWRSIQAGAATLGQAVACPSRTCSTSKHPKRPDTDPLTIGKNHTHPTGRSVGCYTARREMNGGKWFQRTSCGSNNILGEDHSLVGRLDSCLPMCRRMTVLSVDTR